MTCGWGMGCGATWTGLFSGGRRSPGGGLGDVVRKKICGFESFRLILSSCHATSADTVGTLLNVELCGGEGAGGLQGGVEFFIFSFSASSSMFSIVRSLGTRGGG